MPHVAVDLLTDDQGDLIVGSNGDLSLATEAETLTQDVTFRLKTDFGDYTPSPALGADLSSFLGEPNNPATVDLMKEHVILSLTQDDRIRAGTLFVDVIPIDIHAVQVFVIISDRIGEETTPVVVSFPVELLPLTPDNESILSVEE